MIEGIFSFYWIDPSGITRMRWYRSPTEGSKRSDKDDLLSGFLTALMSFSRELFGNELAHLDLMDFKIFFGLLPSKDILALVTTLNFDEIISNRIMKATLEHAKKIPITNDSYEVGSMNHFIPELEQIIIRNIPQTIDDEIIVQVEQLFNQSDILAYLSFDKIKNSLTKKMNPDLDFEISTFLESVFWEKEVSLHRETAQIIEKTFFIPSIRWVFIQIPICNLVAILTPNGYISLIFEISKSIQEIENLLLRFKYIQNR